MFRVYSHKRRRTIFSMLLGIVSLLAWNTTTWASTRLGDTGDIEVQAWYRMRQTFQYDRHGHFDWAQWRNEAFVWLIYNNIVKDGHYPLMAGAQSPALQSAQIGDSVVGKLVVEGSTPVVTRLYLTSKPEPGVRVKEKPGFVTSPYSDTSVGNGAIDVRGYRRGSMLVDDVSGKIFLVP